MRTAKIPRLLAVLLLTALALSGCGVIKPAEWKTNRIAEAIEGMPGVISVQRYATERSLGQSMRSALSVDLEPAVTEAQVLDILTAFAAANLRTGVGNVSASLSLEIDEGGWRHTDFLNLDNEAASSQQLAGLARAWFDLRARFAGADVDLREQIYGDKADRFEVSVEMPEGSTTVDALDAIRYVSALFADIGWVQSLFLAEGGFRVTGDLPSESTLALVQSLLSVDGVLGAEGSFWGDESTSVELTISAESALVDFDLGVSPLMAEVVDLIPRDAVPIIVSFKAEDDGRALPRFRNESCLNLVGEDLIADESRALLRYWARDGRTLLDGSSVESCG